ncbi:MAG: hypothetical protein FJX35_04215 [Alphaproteobacteria bacterium]|nr:hypothetical protein [Alphaproteobacteria bacterium]
MALAFAQPGTAVGFGESLRSSLRPLPDLSQLRCHQVHVARSDDGVTFRADSQPVLDAATAPDAVPDGNGLRLYVVNGEPGKHGIWTVRLEDDGASWRRGSYEPIQIDGAVSGDIAQPDVLRLPDGRLRLYYYAGYFVTHQPKPFPGMVERPHRIMTAVSSDGVNFTGEGRAILLDSAENPTVVPIGDGRYLLAVNQPKSRRILIGISKESSRFVLNGAVLSGGAPELTMLADGSLRLLHDVPGGFGSFRSRDGGRVWEAEAGLRLTSANPVAEPTAVNLGVAGWRLFYRAIKPGCTKS